MNYQNNNPGCLQKILIIEDDQDTLAIVKSLLVDAGFKVYTYMTGLDVEAAVLHYLPDLILLDIGLPGISGIEVCRDIRKLYQLPIIFLSAHAEQGKAYKECMADGFIQKPFNNTELVNTVKLQLNNLTHKSEL